MTALHQSPVDQFAPPTPTRKYPAGWVLLALIAALIATWVPFLVLAAIGFLVLGVLKVWKVGTHG